jgi:hypothetical protein
LHGSDVTDGEALAAASLNRPKRARSGTRLRLTRRFEEILNVAKILVTGKCKDRAKWEAGFRTHADFFRTAYGVSKPVSYGMSEDDYVGTDGLFQDTVKVFVLDKELAV